jgi:hypothetical protein
MYYPKSDIRFIVVSNHLQSVLQYIIVDKNHHLQSVLQYVIVVPDKLQSKTNCILFCSI